METPAHKTKRQRGLFVWLTAMLIMSVPSLQGVGHDWFGWADWSNKVDFAIISSGVGLAILAVALFKTPFGSRN